MPNEISVIFHNVLNYDYHFIIKELANESKRQFECKIYGKFIIQIFLINLQKEPIKLNVKIVDVFLNIKESRTI